MSAELNNIFKVIDVYKQSVIDVMTKLDDTIRTKLNDLNARPGRPSRTEHYELSIEMLKVVQHYLTIFHSTLEISNDVTTKITLSDYHNFFFTQYNTNFEEENDLILPEHDQIAFYPSTSTSSSKNDIVDKCLELMIPEPRNLEVEEVEVKCETEETSNKHKASQEISDQIPLKVGDICVFTHIESMTKFFLTNDGNLFNNGCFNDQMSKMFDEIQNEYSSKEETKEKVGNICCGFAPTCEKWVRLEVLDWMEDDDDDVNVQLIDSGEEFFCDYSDLNCLPDKFAIFPKMAITCRLLGITDDNSLEYFKEFVQNNKFILSSLKKDEDTYVVDLKKIGDDTLLSELFMKNPNVAYTLPTLPSWGESVEVLITAYKNSCNFFAHFIHKRISNSPYSDDFNKLHKTMQRKKTIATYQKFANRPKLNETVIVKEKNEFLRGRCQEYLADEQFVIFLVDFGFSVTKNLDDLRVIDKKIVNLPFQAVECVLYECTEKPDVDVALSKNFFDNCMYMQTFNGIIMYNDFPVPLLLWNSDGTDLRYEMKECNLVDYQDD